MLVQHTFIIKINSDVDEEAINARLSGHLHQLSREVKGDIAIYELTEDGTKKADEIINEK